MVAPSDPHPCARGYRLLEEGHGGIGPCSKMSFFSVGGGLHGHDNARAREGHCGGRNLTHGYVTLAFVG